MANIIASPTRYIQGKGELQNLRQHVEMLGKKLFILTTASRAGTRCTRDQCKRCRLRLHRGL